MKKMRKWLFLILAGALLPLSGSAAELVWDTSTAAGYQNGDGTWGPYSPFPNWSTSGTDGTAPVRWFQGNNAWFGGDGSTAATPDVNYTVTVYDDMDIQTGDLRQIAGGAGNATITGGSLTTTYGARCDRGTFTINSALTTASGEMRFQTAPGATLVIGGANTYNNSQTVLRSSSTGGNIRLDSAGALGTSSLIYFRHHNLNLDVNGNSYGQAISLYGSYTGTLRNDSGTASTMSGNVNLGANSTLLAGGDGDLTFSGAISGDASVATVGSGTLILAGGVDVDRNITVSSDLVLDDTGEVAFTVGADGVNNAIEGTGDATFDGAFAFDLSGAGTTQGDAWQIIAATLNETYGATFAVDGFTDQGDGTWVKDANGTTYEFSELTGELGVIPEPATFMMLGVGGLLTAIIRRFRVG